MEGLVNDLMCLLNSGTSLPNGTETPAIPGARTTPNRQKRLAASVPAATGPPRSAWSASAGV